MAGRYFPKKVVEYVAKTGFITKETWEKFFFSGGTERWKHLAWANLERRKYLVPHSYRRLQKVYVLNRFNREVRDWVQGQAARPPAGAQLDHDEVLNRGLLLIERGGFISHWVAESQLKAQGAGEHRIETQGQLIKYPDAIVELNGSGKRVQVAIELETTLKCRKRYVQIMGAYAGMRDLCAVLFIWKSPAIERAIKETAERTYFPREAVRLGFVTLPDWQKDPCAAKIEIDGKIRSWASLLGVHSEFT